MSTSRREFLKRAGAAGAILSVPYTWSSSQARAEDLNGKPTIAAIGVGGSRGMWGQGGSVARRASRYGQMIAVCDVDEVHTAEFNKKYDDKLNTYVDYRKLFENEKPDIVTIGTPDHWHVPIAISALEAGCHVYCEKPLTLTIEEGFRIRKAADASNKVFQVGTQQRSEYDLRFLKAIAIVRSGWLGNNVKAYLAIGDGVVGGPFDAVQTPEGLDWDMWLGPAAKVDFCQERRKEFRWFYEYSGGKVTDWGAHHIDIAQWALGVQDTGPIRVTGMGKFPPLIPDHFDWPAYFDSKATLPNAYNTAEEFSINLEYANGALINVNNKFERDDGRTKFDNGILFEGDKGRIFVNRDKLTGKPVEERLAEERDVLDDMIGKLYNGKRPGNHMRNFFECIEDHSTPVADVATHHRTMTSCHLCNIGLMLGRDLEWDPGREEFVGDEQANALVSRKPREEFSWERTT
jgi:predicted dehydrogenase